MAISHSFLRSRPLWGIRVARLLRLSKERRRLSGGEGTLPTGLEDEVGRLLKLGGMLGGYHFLNRALLTVVSHDRKKLLQSTAVQSESPPFLSLDQYEEMSSRVIELKVARLSQTHLSCEMVG